MKTNSLLPGLLLISSLALAQAQIAGPILNPANGNYYYLLGLGSWVSAEQAAVSLGGHLATVNDSAENQWILNTFSQYGGESRNLLIGLNDRNVEGTFEWSSGEPVLYQNWEAGQPDSALGDEDGVFMWPSSSAQAGQWADISHTFDSWGYGVVEAVPITAQIQPAVGILWNSRSNVHYQVQFSLNLATNSWTNLGPTVLATNTNSMVFDLQGVGPRRFYRVLQVP